MTAALAAVAVLAGGLAACSPKRPTPDAAAGALAAALASGDFSRVALTSGAPDAGRLATDRKAVFEGLGGATPTVTLASVAVDPKDGTLATAALHWSWDLGTSRPWTYDVTARLRLATVDAGQAW